MTESVLSVLDDASAHRYRALLDGAPAGFAAYRLEPERVVFVHTVVDPNFAGHGVGSALARGALDDVRRQGKRVTALCPFIAAFIAGHDEYADLLD